MHTDNVHTNSHTFYIYAIWLSQYLDLRNLKEHSKITRRKFSKTNFKNKLFQGKTKTKTKKEANKQKANIFNM